MIRIFGLKNCDTTRKATSELGGELVDIREHPLSRDQLERFRAAFGDKLLNTRSRTWRELDEVRRGDDPIDLLTAFPPLMKRPVIEVDGALFLGLSPEAYAAIKP